MTNKLSYKLSNFSPCSKNDIFSERYQEYQQEEDGKPEGDTRITSLSPAEEIVLNSMTLQSVDSCINEVKETLEKTSSLLVILSIIWQITKSERCSSVDIIANAAVLIVNSKYTEVIEQNVKMF